MTRKRRNAMVSKAKGGEDIFETNATFLCCLLDAKLGVVKGGKRYLVPLATL